MTNAQQNLFSGQRLQMNDSIALTIQSLQAYGQSYDHWCVAWSGGKDSTATITLLAYLLNSGKLSRPKTIRAFYADTRLELTPLYFAAQEIARELAEEHGIEVEQVMAPLDRRFMVYLLGRGVPPPNNNRLRWCTRQIKIEPMQTAAEAHAVRLGLGKMVPHPRVSDKSVYEGFGDQKLLFLTGVRQGESAIRDQRIVQSCSKDGAECGQGWFQSTLPDALCDKLAPLLHWRVCHVWEWLKHWAPLPEFGDFSTRFVAEAYGGDEAEELNARTGCIGCPLASEDKGLNAALRLPQWAYLAPLTKLRPFWDEIRNPKYRKRKTGKQTLKDGSMPANPQRLGPLTMESRAMALDYVLGIQNEVNRAALDSGRPTISLISLEEEARIRELWATNTWPDLWDGTEPNGEEWFDTVLPGGYTQPLLFGPQD
jgi:DNA sulfur modification protein DndC